MKQYQAPIIHVLKYFSNFQYPPSFEEIYTYLPVKITKNELKIELERMIAKHVLLSKELDSVPLVPSRQCSLDAARVSGSLSSVPPSSLFTHTSFRYTLPGYSIYFKNYADRTVNTENKLKVLYKFTSIIKWLPYIQLIGLSGSVSMMNAKLKDDIDICIITKKNRLWTGRLLTSLITSLMGMRRKRNDTKVNNKICLNLFFDEQSVKVPIFKQTEYVGHEVLQMKPIMNKDFTYETFLNANKWTFKLFPNFNLKKQAKFVANISPKSFQMGNFASLIGNFIEFICKKYQLHLINQHKTTEIITDTQLWFFPDDYERKLRARS